MSSLETRFISHALSNEYKQCFSIYLLLSIMNIDIPIFHSIINDYDYLSNEFSTKGYNNSNKLCLLNAYIKNNWNKNTNASLQVQLLSSSSKGA